MKNKRHIELRLHTDARGVLWYAKDGERATTFGEEPAKFLRLPWLRQVARIRLLGALPNVRLLLELFQSLDRGATFAVLVGGPRVCPTAVPSDRPDLILQQLIISALPSSKGGWHQLSPREQPVYALMHALSSNADEAELSTLLQQHPAWPALSFVPGCSLPHAARMVSRIVDPRWYVSITKPDSRKPLYRFMGLDDAYVKMALGQPYASVQGVAQRAKLVLDSWASGVRAPEGDAMFLPENFIWRACQTHSDPVKSLVRGSRKFLAFVRDVWLHSLAPAQRELFVPEYFFGSPDEARAYKAHVAKLPEQFRGFHTRAEARP